MMVLKEKLSDAACDKTSVILGTFVEFHTSVVGGDEIVIKRSDYTEEADKRGEVALDRQAAKKLRDFLVRHLGTL